MNSTELIDSCKKIFEDYHEGKESFEDELIKWFHHRHQLTVNKVELQYFLSTCKSFHWRSFYNGFLFGATQHLKDEQNTTT